MRPLCLATVLIAVSLQAAQPSPSDPLWDGHESVAAYAQRAHLETEKTIDLGGGVKMELVLIPAGQFFMGTPEPNKPEITVLSAQVLIGIGVTLALALLAFLLMRKRTGRRFSFSLRWLLAFSLACSVMVWGGTRWYLALVLNREYVAAVTRYDAENASEKPGHPVLISKAFYMGKYVVTQEQYEAVRGGDSSYHKGPKNPVERMNWDDANAFCEELNAKFKATLPNGMSLQLPTEAQWEYACRAGTKTRFYSGDADSDLDAVAWYKSNSGDKPHPVGGKKTNGFGLYDMHGNIWQWCQDWYDKDYYNNSPTHDPKGPTTGTDRVHRGGCWGAPPVLCRSALRCGTSPSLTLRYTNYGFRCILSPFFSDPQRLPQSRTHTDKDE